jgi:hypothetical protein
LCEKSSSSYSRPLVVTQSRRQALEPCWFDRQVVIHKGQDATPSFTNAGVERIRLPRLLLEQVTDTPGVLVTEALDDLTRMIA